MIHVFHGFLGSPDDFKFLSETFEVELHDLYLMDSEEILRRIKPQDSIIGYSLGGRIAMDLAIRLEFKINKLILVNAHPGLQNQGELPEREKFETQVLNKLKNETGEDFLRWWNKLPIFQHDLPLTGLAADKQAASIELFSKYRLTQQPDYLPRLNAYKDKITWIIGTEDSKYFEMAQSSLAPAHFRICYISGGHRLFQRKKEFVSTLTQALA